MLETVLRMALLCSSEHIRSAVSVLGWVSNPDGILWQSNGTYSAYSTKPWQLGSSRPSCLVEAGKGSSSFIQNHTRKERVWIALTKAYLHTKNWEAFIKNNLKHPALKKKRKILSSIHLRNHMNSRPVSSTVWPRNNNKEMWQPFGQQQNTEVK